MRLGWSSLYTHSRVIVRLIARMHHYPAGSSSIHGRSWVAVAGACALDNQQETFWVSALSSPRALFQKNEMKWALWYFVVFIFRGHGWPWYHIAWDHFSPPAFLVQVTVLTGVPFVWDTPSLCVSSWGDYLYLLLSLSKVTQCGHELYSQPVNSEAWYSRTGQSLVKRKAHSFGETAVRRSGIRSWFQPLLSGKHGQVTSSLSFII